MKKLYHFFALVFLFAGNAYAQTASTSCVDNPSYNVGTSVFQKKYGYLPGDIPDATKGGFAATKAGFNKNGNGNGVIDPEEQAEACDELTRAGYIGGPQLPTKPSFRLPKLKER